MTEDNPMTPDQKDAFYKRRRKRSIAIGAVLAVLVVIFYAITIAKLGPDVMRRDL